MTRTMPTPDFYREVLDALEDLCHDYEETFPAEQLQMKMFREYQKAKSVLAKAGAA